MTFAILTLLTVIHVATTGNDANPGTEDAPLKTISAAAGRAQPGDTVLVQPGIYRERVAPARGGEKDKPIIYRSAKPHAAIVRGSEPFRPKWEPTDDAVVFFGAFDQSLFPDGNPFYTTINIAGGPNPKAKGLAAGQVFVDGKPLTQAHTRDELRAMPNAWFAGSDGLFVHCPVAGREVEVTVRNRIFAPRKRGLKYVCVEGFVFEHCANQGPFPQAGAVSARSGSHWVFENNIIRWAATIGLDCGSETWAPADLADTEKADRRLMIGGHCIVRGNTVTDNGLCGIAAWNTGNTQIISNVVERNNRLHFRAKVNAEWEEQAGIKVHGFNNGLIDGNVVRDNAAHGIWLDNGYTRARITRNVVQNNSGAGIFLELGTGPCLVDHNVVVGTRPFSDFYGGDGIYAHDASGITVEHNRLVNNARYGVFMRTITERKAGGAPAETSRVRIAHNVLLDNLAGPINLPKDGKRSHDNVVEDNTTAER